MDFIIAKGTTQTAARKIGTLNPVQVVDHYKKVKKKYDKVKKKWIYKNEPVYKIVYNASNLPPTAAKRSATGTDYAYLTEYADIDIECGGANDFEIRLPREDFNGLGIEIGDYIYTEGEEYGGRIDGLEVNSSAAEVIVTGTTWRGLLAQCIIAPSVGADYVTVSGDLQTILADILPRAGDAGAIFNATGSATGVTVSGYKFYRYCTKLDGINRLLADKNYKLKIWTERGAPGGTFSVYAQATPVETFSEEYSQETTDRNLQIIDDRGGVNHLICLGAGELKERQRVDLYVSTDGEIIESGGGTVYTGAAERVAVYDDRNVSGETAADKLAQLKKDGINKLKELMNAQSLAVKTDQKSALIGDLVGGTDTTTGVTALQPITSKIYRKSGNEETIEVITGESEGFTDENY